MMIDLHKKNLKSNIHNNGYLPIMSFEPFESIPDLIHGLSLKEDSLLIDSKDERFQYLRYSLLIQNKSILRLKQVHGTKIYSIHTLKQGFKFLDGNCQGDGFITNVKGLFVAIGVADCVPIFFVDPVNIVCGVIHAGWRGSFCEIALKTVKILKRNFSSECVNIMVVIGPSISPCCYEISETLAYSFIQKFSNKVVQERKGRYFLDLKEVNRIQLLSAGLEEKNIYVSDYCTCCRDDLFYSYRGKNFRGNLIALIGFERSERK
jgi:YfiH family protein